MKKLKPIIKPIFCFSFLFLLVFSTKAQDEIVIVSYVTILDENPRKSKMNQASSYKGEWKIQALKTSGLSAYAILARDLITIRILEKRIEEESSKSTLNTSAILKTKLSELKAKYKIS